MVKQVTGGVLNGGGVPYVSEVIQSSRCTLMTERLFRGFGVRLLAKLISRWFDLKFKIINCKSAAWSVETVDEMFRNFVCPVSTLSGHFSFYSDPKLPNTSKRVKHDVVDNYENLKALVMFA